MDMILDRAQQRDSRLEGQARSESELQGSRPNPREASEQHPAEAGMDADMLDMIARFEQNFAELRPARPEPQVGLSELVLDETFSIPTVAHARSAPTAQQAPQDARMAQFEPVLPPPEVKPELHREHGTASTHANVATQGIGSASRSRKPRSIGLAAGALVVAVSLAVGYAAGRTSHGKSHTGIETTAQGGMLLRLDPSLGKR